VYTVRDGLSDGLYGDGGAEHFTNPGYERYREYVKELELTAHCHIRGEKIF
jgi:monoamine oxidase